MGDWRVTIEAVGGHGCGRGTEIDATKVAWPAKDATGYVVTRCRRMDCPDCLATEFVERLKRIGTVAVAKLEHWPVPGAAGTRREEGAGPVDDLLRGTRDRPWR